MAGELFAIFGSLFILSGSLLIIAFRPLLLRNFQPSDFLRISILMGLWVFLFLNAAFSTVGRADFVFNTIISHVAIVIAAAVLIADRNSLSRFCSLYHSIILLLSLSGIITFFLIIAGFAPALSMGRVDYGYHVVMELYLPVSTVYHWTWISGISIPRQSFWFREAGIAPVFLAIAIFIGEQNRCRLWRQLSIAFGMILTFSTLAPALAIISVFFIFCARIKAKYQMVSAVAFVFLLPVTILALFYTPDIGIIDKSEFAERSILYRLESMREAWVDWGTLLVGEGMFRAHLGVVDTSLLAAVDSIGLIGFVSFLIFYFSPFLEGKRTLYWAIGVLPSALALVLFSQPLFISPFFNLFFIIPLWRLGNDGNRISLR